MTTPIDMILHCPACGLQHIDAPEKPKNIGRNGFVVMHSSWDNPPHRSHLCLGCGHIWRPADVPTNGVAAIQTKGKNDSPIEPSRSLDVRQILLGIVPGDGNGQEVYAKCVEDVERKLTELGQRLEDALGARGFQQ